MQLTAPQNGTGPTRLSFSSSSTTAVQGAAVSDSATLDAGLALLSLAAVPVIAPVAALTSTTGLVYDARCLLHQANYNHVEKPARASETMQLLKSSGLYQRCVHVPARAARDEEIIGQAHTKEHVQAIDATGERELQRYRYNMYTYQCAERRLPEPQLHIAVMCVRVCSSVSSVQRR